MPLLMTNMSTTKKHISDKTSKRVFVGLSGGVDSSVSAALLKDQGYEVTGAYIKTWQPDWLPCTWKEERRDAMRVAARLGIPFVTIDCVEEYKKYVADYMISEYKAGRTPNPDVMCNREIKFGSFFRQAQALGADYIATGHYARSIDGNLYEGLDTEKDQSYFLWTLLSKDLKNILFPVGHLQKTQVRELARSYGLRTAEKKDSQGICFLGDIDMKDFLKHYIDQKEGVVLDTEGNQIGIHTGAWFFTIGERHGFTINAKNNNDSPYYVVSKDVEKNTITVSQKNSENILKHATKSVLLDSVVLRGDIPKNINARVRYRQIPQDCQVEKDGDMLKVIFSKPQEGVSVGQSVVFYDKQKCLGGGIISTVVLT